MFGNVRRKIGPISDDSQGARKQSVSGRTRSGVLRLWSDRVGIVFGNVCGKFGPVSVTQDVLGSTRLAVGRDQVSFVFGRNGSMCLS